MPAPNLTPEQQARVNRGKCCAPSCGNDLPPVRSWEPARIYCSETPGACKSRAFRERKSAGLVLSLDDRARLRALERMKELRREADHHKAQAAYHKGRQKALERDAKAISDRYELPQLPLAAK